MPALEAPRITEFLKQLFADPIFITFLAVFGGLVLGTFKFRKLSLGSAGVFFVSFILGMLGLSTSPYITNLGLIIFMYALGVQAGPSFFNAMSRRGLPFILIAACVALSTMGFSLLLAVLFKFPRESLLGIYTGSMTASSALAILMDSGYGNKMLEAYGITYPMGIIAGILFVQIMPTLLRKNLRHEFDASKPACISPEGAHLIMRKFLVENPDIAGKSLAELKLRDKMGTTVSRLRRRGRIIIPGGDTRLKLDDVVLIVAPLEEMDSLHRIFGQETHENLEFDPAVEARQIVVTNPSLHHVNLSAIALHAHYHVNITRILKSGIEFAPSADHTLELGDTVVAVGRKGNLNRVERFLGKREKTFAEVDFASMCFGIAMGMIIGKISFPIPGLCQFKVGISGGALIMGLFLGYVRRFGFLTGQMSASAKMILKEFGLALFTAGVGATAGERFVHITPGQIGIIFASSGIILFLSMLVVFFIAYRLMKIDLVQSLACVCGGFMNSLAMSSVTTQVNSEEPSNAFAACYPLSLFGTILVSQILTLFR